MTTTLFLFHKISLMFCSREVLKSLFVNLRSLQTIEFGNLLYLFWNCILKFVIFEMKKGRYFHKLPIVFARGIDWQFLKMQEIQKLFTIFWKKIHLVCFFHTWLTCPMEINHHWNCRFSKLLYLVPDAALFLPGCRLLKRTLQKSIMINSEYQFKNITMIIWHNSDYSELNINHQGKFLTSCLCCFCFVYKMKSIICTKKFQLFLKAYLSE